VSELVAVVAGTPMGVALAKRLAADGHAARAVAPGELRAAADARLVVVDCAPSALRETARALGDVLDGSHLVVHTVRGLLPDGQRASEALHDETPVRRIGVLAGPLWARDLDAGRPSAGVVASRHPEVVDGFSAALSTPSLRIYRGRDPLGVEIASAMVDLFVVGVGAAQEVGLTETTVAVMVVRAVRELGRLIVALGGDAQTAAGLAGLGDFLVRSRSTDAHAFQLGQRLARGDTAARAELAPSAQAIRTISRSARVPAHIFAGLIALIDGKLTAKDLVSQLMALPVLDE
jgi:glycerol-3-phosphate dehydrogenase (NAD(P)+)